MCGVKGVPTQIVRGVRIAECVGFRTTLLGGYVDYKKESGRRLAEARDELGWSQARLSREVGGVFSPSRIANYEQGTRTLKQREAVILGKALGKDPAYLMCLDIGGEMTVQERDLLQSWRCLPERERMDYLRRISALALTYRDPVPDERMGESWKAPEPPKAKKKTPRKTR